MSSKVSLLDEVAEVVDSLHKTPSYVDHGYPMVRVTDVKYGNLELSKALLVDEHVYKEFSRRYKPSRGDIIISRVGSYGVFSKVHKTPFCLGQNTAAIIPKDIHSDYLYAVLNSNFVWAQIEGVVVGSTQKTLSLKAIKALKIPRLEPSCETKIAQLASTIDDRIALLRETNATLEAIAQALFKSWFVDFDPVYAKQQGITPAGMNDATAALFPDGFEESALGEVPKGWRLVPFGQLLSHTIGGDWGSESPDDTNSTKVAIIRGTDMPDLQSGAVSRVPIRYTNSKKLSTRKLEVGDIILEVSGGSKDQPTGRSFYIGSELLKKFDCPVEPASFCRLLRPNSPAIGTLLSQHLTFIYAEGKTWEYQNQSTGIANFQTTHFLASELVAIPSDDVLDVFSDIIQTLMKRTQLSQINNLATLRDTLLPRLISGQLRLPEAEEQLAEAIA